MNLSENFVVGTCMEMCHQFEINMREREKLLHFFEILPGTENNSIPTADRKHTIKSFSRSAAGKNMNVAENIRPPDVLLQTVFYLLNEIVSKENVSWLTIYDFVMDRLRAVRQDLVIQNSSAAHYVTILQPIVRFHAYSSYRLCEDKGFDPHINKVHLQECLKRLLCAYEDCYTSNKNGKDKSDDLNPFLNDNRPFFESLYIVFNLGNNLAITRGINLPRIWKTDLVKLSLDISLAYARNNFLRVCKLLNRLPPLHAALVYLHLVELRRKALKIMSVAYNSKNLTFPLNVLKDLLLYDSFEHLKKDCQYYGLKVTEDTVCFMKSDFNDSKDTLPTRKSKLMDRKLNEVNISELLLYNVNIRC